MKALLAILLLAFSTAQAGAGEHVVLYARLLEDLNVELTDGSVWQMDKGDCFPVIAYKEAHTKLILRLAGTTFVVAGEHAAIVSEKETPAAIDRYRATLQNYIDGFSARWKANAEAAKKK
jgi:apolipoprotein N-acyltransferase